MVICLLLEKTELDKEIAETLQAVLDLKKTGDYGAMQLAEADLRYMRTKK